MKKERFTCKGECEDCFYLGACDEKTRQHPGCAIAGLFLGIIILFLIGIGWLLTWILLNLV